MYRLPKEKGNGYKLKICTFFNTMNIPQGAQQWICSIECTLNLFFFFYFFFVKAVLWFTALLVAQFLYQHGRIQRGGGGGGGGGNEGSGHP